MWVWVVGGDVSSIGEQGKEGGREGGRWAGSRPRAQVGRQGCWGGLYLSPGGEGPASEPRQGGSVGGSVSEPRQGGSVGRGGLYLRIHSQPLSRTADAKREKSSISACLCSTFCRSSAARRRLIFSSYQTQTDKNGLRADFS